MARSMIVDVSGTVVWSLMTVRCSMAVASLKRVRNSRYSAPPYQTPRPMPRPWAEHPSQWSMPHPPAHPPAYWPESPAGGPSQPDSCSSSGLAEIGGGGIVSDLSPDRDEAPACAAQPADAVSHNGAATA